MHIYVYAHVYERALVYLAAGAEVHFGVGAECAETVRAATDAGSVTFSATWFSYI